MKYLDSTISVFDTASCTAGKTDTLRNFLLSADMKAKQIIEKIRENTEDKQQVSALKRSLPCATISGTFRHRNSEGLINHSGLIAIDIDTNENPLIEDWELLKEDLSGCPNILYAGLSCSGKGLFAVIPIEHPDKHILQFDALFHLFDEMGIILDKSCRDVTRLRFKSYDERPYLNENAEPFNGILRPQRKKIGKLSTSTDNSRIEALIKRIEDSKADITAEYGDWVRIGYAMATEYGEDGRTIFHRISRYNLDYDEAECDKQFSECLKGNKEKVSVNTLFQIAKLHDITLN